MQWRHKRIDIFIKWSMKVILNNFIYFRELLRKPRLILFIFCLLKIDSILVFLIFPTQSWRYSELLSYFKIECTKSTFDSSMCTHFSFCVKLHKNNFLWQLPIHLTNPKSNEFDMWFVESFWGFQKVVNFVTPLTILFANASCQ